MRRDQTLEEGLDDLETNNRTPRPCTTHRLTIERGSHLGLGTSLHSSSTLGFQGGGGDLYIGQPRARGKIYINREFWALHGPGPKGLNMPGVEQAGDSGQSPDPSSEGASDCPGLGSWVRTGGRS